MERREDEVKGNNKEERGEASLLFTVYGSQETRNKTPEIRLEEENKK